MSYTPYTTPTGSVPPPTSTTYPYGAYQTAYAGAYPYQGHYATGVTGYSWPYGYSYQHSQAAAHLQQLQRIATQPQSPLPTPTVPTPTVAHVATPAVATSVVPATPTAHSATTPRPTTTTFSTYTPAYAREPVQASSSSHNVGATRGSKRQSNMRGLFSKDLRSLMYGFGDDRNPSNDTVNVMEEILIEYIADVCQVAGANSKRSRLSIEDLRKALSRPADAKKLARLEELLFMQEDIKRARGMFEESDIQNPKQF
ncbi:TFIID-18kDa-domain-containing protein [Coprinopsis marcescibilis]|uniref:Transcription initiation factor TFIID subunit 13 n=1 Tax=Coprinopsis marcescibilis TaxID=230819 RepID=A0A5C3LBZ8_COPMA|nr:TFIID-18kDa-domain-containing protein [Coprinopsis marcescibilis]